MQHDTAPPAWFKTLLAVCVGFGALFGTIFGNSPFVFIVWAMAGAGVAILIAAVDAIMWRGIRADLHEDHDRWRDDSLRAHSVAVRTDEQRERDRDRLRRAQDVQRDAERRQTLDKAGDLD